MGLFNHTLESVSDTTYRFEYDNAFGERIAINIPKINNSNIKIGGTASAGQIVIYRGCVIDNDSALGCIVALQDGRQIECLKIGEIPNFGIVYVYEHLSYQDRNFGQFDLVAASKQPIHPNLHAINVIYQKDDRELTLNIDPHTGYCREPNHG